MDRELLKQASAIADQYRIILDPDEDCGYVGYPLELPGVFGDGKTADACVRSVREAATVLIAYYFEEGRTPPPPSTEVKRTQQINIRVTDEEKLRIEAAARRDGFRGISDFVRSASLTHTSQR